MDINERNPMQAPETTGRIYGCTKCGTQNLTINETFDHPCAAITAAKTAQAVEQGKGEILEDIANGVVPADITTFADLNDHVDANEYGGLCDEDHGLSYDEWIQFGNDVQEALNAWISSGRV